MPEPLTAAAIRARLDASASDAERAKIQARMTDDRNEVIGVRMGTVFKIARDNERMPLPEVDLLLDSDAYEMRIVAVSVLDFRARRRDADREALYEPCELLAADPEKFVQTNVGVALREIGRVDPARLEEFLGRRAGDLTAHARRTARSALPG